MSEGPGQWSVNPSCTRVRVRVDRAYDGERAVTESSVPSTRLYELIKDSPKTGSSPTVWAWPQLIDHLKVASQPVQGPWPPHQEPRPEPDAESLPVAIPDPHRPGVDS